MTELTAKLRLDDSGWCGTPPNTFDMKTTQGRRKRLAQLRKWRGLVQARYKELGKATRGLGVAKFNKKVRAEFRKEHGYWNENPPGLHPLTPQWTERRKRKGQMNLAGAWTRRIEGTNAGARAQLRRRRKKDRLRKRQLFSYEDARAERRERDRANYRAIKDARNARRRAEYADRKRSPKSA